MTTHGCEFGQRFRAVFFVKSANSVGNDFDSLARFEQPECGEFYADFCHDAVDDITFGGEMIEQVSEIDIRQSAEGLLFEQYLFR